MGVKKGYFNRKEVSELIGVCTNQVGIMDRNGKLPCPGEPFMMKSGKRYCPVIFYPEEPILKWIAKGIKHKSTGRPRKEIPEPVGITFKKVFSGYYLTTAQKNMNYKKLSHARANPPVTKRIRFKGES